jgi:hypothetical protein
MVNNGIDIDNVSLVNQNQNQRILFIGTMSDYPNIDRAYYFVQHILPIVWQHNANVTFCIAGAELPQAILALSQDPRITLIADPENMSDVAETCQITVVPLRISSGTRIKILHSVEQIYDWQRIFEAAEREMVECYGRQEAEGARFPP